MDISNLPLTIKLNNPTLFDINEYSEMYSNLVVTKGAELAEWMNGILGLRGLEAPRLAITLGSGLNALIEKVEVLGKLPFTALELPDIKADGHNNEFILADYQGSAVLLQSGRFHSYQNLVGSILALPARIQAYAGLQTFIITNAAGGLAQEHKVGDIVLISDLDAENAPSPSTGLAHPALGTQFFNVSNISNAELREMAHGIAAKLGMAERVHTGCYYFNTGPDYETPAQIQKYVEQRQRMIDLELPEMALATVGMSTAPEAKALCHLRTLDQFKHIRMLLISGITNMAAGIGGSVPTHEEVKQAAPMAADKMIRIIHEMRAELTRDLR